MKKITFLLFAQLVERHTCNQCSTHAETGVDLADFLQTKIKVEPPNADILQKGEHQEQPLTWQMPFHTSLIIAAVAILVALLPRCLDLATEFRSKVAHLFASYAAIPRPSPSQLFSDEASSNKFDNVFDLLPDTDAPCICELPETGGRPPLSFAALRRFAFSEEARLDRFDIRGSDRLCTMIPNGPEAAVCLFVLPLRCVFAPLNPALTRSEVEFEFEDLPCHSLILEHSDVKEVQRSSLDTQSPGAVGLQVARARSVKVLLLSPSIEVAGLFRLSFHGTSQSPGLPHVMRSAEILNKRKDLALVLHTSGTTKKPKIVPLTHESLLVGALCIKSTLRRAAYDACLNLMPLYHIHGLAVNVLATAIAGSTVICSVGYRNPSQALGLLTKSGATWYSAVPTMHLGLLDAAEGTLRSGECIWHRCSLVRNCSAALAQVIAERLEDALECVVLPTYAMSESMPIASNPMPPYCRDLCSVGFASGPRLRLQDEAGQEPAQGKEGEVCVKGDCVMRGYEYRAHMDGNPNSEAFAADGWFRTGDKGYVNARGFLCLTGRLKEIISRGGEKISPLEIESVLRHSTDIHDCVAFSVPHVQLGETVGLVIHPRESSNIKPSSEALSTIQDFALKRGLNRKWMPEVLVFMPSIPKGSTGKPARIGLAKRLGLPTVDASTWSPCVFDASSGCITASVEEQESKVTEPIMAGTSDSLGMCIQSSEEAVSEMRTKDALYGVAMLLIICQHFATFYCHKFTCLFEIGMPNYPVALGLIRHFLSASRLISVFTMCSGYLESKERNFQFDGKREAILVIALFWNYWMFGPLIALRSLITGEPYHCVQANLSSMFVISTPVDYYVRFLLVARVLLLIFHKLNVPGSVHLGIACAWGIYTTFHPDPAWWMALNAGCNTFTLTEFIKVSNWKPVGPRHGLACWIYQYALFVFAVYYFPPAIQVIKHVFGSIRWTSWRGWCGKAGLFILALFLLVCYPDIYYPNRPYKLLPTEEQFLADGMPGWYCAQSETTLQGAACFLAQLPADAVWLGALTVLVFPGCRLLELVGRSTLGCYLLHIHLFHDPVLRTGIVIRGWLICPSLPVILRKIASIPIGTTHWYGTVAHLAVPLCTCTTIAVAFALVAIACGWIFDFLFFGFVRAAATLLTVLFRKARTTFTK